MVMLSLALTAALLSSSRFGPADIVDVQKIGTDARITAYGDMHLVRIEATRPELDSCQEKIRETGARICTFSHGGTISLTPRPRGTLVVIEDGAQVNIVDFELDGQGLAHAAQALGQ